LRAGTGSRPRITEAYRETQETAFTSTPGLASLFFAQATETSAPAPTSAFTSGTDYESTKSAKTAPVS
jgi:hypothetical protein